MQRCRSCRSTPARELNDLVHLSCSSPLCSFFAAKHFSLFKPAICRKFQTRSSAARFCPFVHALCLVYFLVIYKSVEPSIKISDSQAFRNSSVFASTQKCKGDALLAEFARWPTVSPTVLSSHLEKHESSMIATYPNKSSEYRSRLRKLTIAVFALFRCSCFSLHFPDCSVSAM